MDKTIYQSGRLYLNMDNKYRWVTTPELAIKIWGSNWEARDREYPTAIDDPSWIGKPITNWPENDEPEPNGNGHSTSKLYKMLYVCPWYSKTTGFAGLDQIKEVGFNVYHTWSPFQWEQERYWDTPEGKADCLRQISEMLQALKDRKMYGCLQVPLGGPRQAKLRQRIKELQLQQRPMFVDSPEAGAIDIQIFQLKVKLRDELMAIRGPEQRPYLTAAIEVMARFNNSIVGTVEEPDLSIPPSPTLEGQKDIHDVVKWVAPNIQIWGCFNGGISEKTFNPDAFDVLITDSYAYSRNNGAIPGTKAAETSYAGDPWWHMSRWIKSNKFKQLHNSVPDDMPIINIQQGMWNTSEGHVLPNVEQEFNLYNREFGLNSVGFYPHGYGQGMGGVYVMHDTDTRDCGIKNQCRALMKKLDMGGR